MDAFDTLIGRSPGLEALLRSAKIVAATDATVLILGETGTGKELLAHALQQASPRAGKPFIIVNCAAVPEGLAESELFGHRRGAFSGAESDQPGRLGAAHGGTLFLDEVDALPLALQGKLLRFLDTGECQPVGATRPDPVDVRLLAASHTDLSRQLAEGRFRKDLYYRLNVVPLALPPLRERTEDIEVLLAHFLQRFAHEHGLAPSTFSRPALERLRAYGWPGNVRELRNLCERLSVLLPGRVLGTGHLPAEITGRGSAPASLFSLPDTGISLDQMERDLIQQALRRTSGNRSRAARLLGISRDTLLYRMRKHGID